MRPWKSVHIVGVWHECRCRFLRLVFAFFEQRIRSLELMLCRGKLSVLPVGGPGDRLVDGDADGTAERLTDRVGVTAVLALLFGSMGTRSVGIASSNLACEMEKFERS